MMHRWSLAVAVLVSLGAVIALYSPGTIRIGSAEGILITSALIAVTAGLVAMKSSAQTGRTESRVESPELRTSVPRPGDDVDESIVRARPPNPYIRDRRDLRTRTRTLALGILTAFDGLSDDAAHDAINTGTWTTDTEAATFLQSTAPSRGLLTRTRRTLRRQTRFDRRLDHTLDVLATHMPGTDETPTRTGRSWSRPTLTAPFRGVHERFESTTETDHWRGVIVVALVGIGLGIVADRPAVLLAGAVGIGYLVYARAGGPPTLELEIDRTVSSDRTAPDEPVEVRTTVRNAGSNTIADLRLVDGVPAGVTVTDGSPRRGVLLRPGQSVTLTYTITAPTGRHRWTAMTAIGRSLNGTYETRAEFDRSSELVSVPLPRPTGAGIPLNTDGAISVGQLRSDRAGEGIEFHTVRQYRPGDRRTRIDWRRYARTRDLTTVSFHEERATTVMIAIDAREAAYRRPDPETPHAVERSIDAANRAAVSLLDAGHRVGLTAVSPDPFWLRPNADRATRSRIREQLADAPALSQTPPEGEFRPFGWTRWVRSRIDGDAQLVLFSPLCDDGITEVIIGLAAHGHAITVISPDPTTADTTGTRLVQMERSVRIAALRRRGITVVGWPADEPFDMSLTRARGVQAG